MAVLHLLLEWANINKIDKQVIIEDQKIILQPYELSQLESDEIGLIIGKLMSYFSQ